MIVKPILEKYAIWNRARHVEWKEMAVVSANPGVLVIGGGLAALCAAISARQCQASVAMVEQAPRELRGGNTRHSRNFRICHDAPSPLFPDCYGEADFLADMVRASDNACDADLAQVLIDRSSAIPAWLEDNGATFQTANIPYSRKTAFFLGGGKALVNSLYATAETLGVDIRYETEVTNLRLDGRVDLVSGGETQTVRPRAVVACCGGYQANREWLRREWGDAAQSLINRGTVFAQGAVLRSLLDQGVAAVGKPGACHLVAVDARSPADDSGIVTRVDGMEFGVVVDRDGRRFVDETTISGPSRYSTWGQLVARRADQAAVMILDSIGIRKIRPSVIPPLQARSATELADILGMPASNLDCSMRESQRLVNAPFHAFPMRPGVSFTCHGVKVDSQARLVMTDGAVCENLFAAGMIMAPNVLGTGYLAGAAMTVGAVFGKIAGEGAARHAHD